MSRAPGPGSTARRHRSRPASSASALLINGYLLLRSGWAEFPVRLPIAHEMLLLAGTGVQFLLVLIGFLDLPLAGLGREIGAYLALLASAAAVIPVARPVLHSWPGRR